MLHASFPFDPSISQSHHKNAWLQQCSNHEDNFLRFSAPSSNFSSQEMRQGVTSDIMQSFEYNPFSHSGNETNFCWKMPKAPTNVASAIEYLLPKHSVLSPTPLLAKSPLTGNQLAQGGQSAIPTFLLPQDYNHAMPCSPRKATSHCLQPSPTGQESRTAAQSTLLRGWGTVGPRGSGIPLHPSSLACESKGFRSPNSRDVDSLARATSVSADSQITEQAPATPSTPAVVGRAGRSLNKQLSTVTSEITREASESPRAARTSGMQSTRLHLAASPSISACGASPELSAAANNIVDVSDVTKEHRSDVTKDLRSRPARRPVRASVDLSSKATEDAAEHSSCKSEEDEEEDEHEQEAAAAAATEDCTEDEEGAAAARSPKCCAVCRTTKTPLWRNGPPGPKSLCNACGIRFNKIKAGKRKATSLEASYLAAFLSQEATPAMAPSSPTPQQRRKVPTGTKQVEHSSAQQVKAPSSHMRGAMRGPGYDLPAHRRKRSRRSDGESTGSGSEGSDKKGAGSSGTSCVSKRPKSSEAPGGASAATTEEEQGAMLLMALFYGGGRL